MDIYTFMERIRFWISQMKNKSWMIGVEPDILYSTTFIVILLRKHCKFTTAKKPEKG